MMTRLTVGILAGLMVIGGSTAWSQRGSARNGGMDNGSIKFDYNDLSKRDTARSEREDRKRKEAEEAKKKAEEEKRRAEREKRNQQDAEKRNGGKATTMSSSKSTTGSKSAARTAAGAKGRATQPVNTGGSTDPTSKEVTEVMLNAVKTQKVVFDREAAKSDPSIILLNEPKFDPDKRTRAGDASGIAAPL